MTIFDYRILPNKRPPSFFIIANYKELKDKSEVFWEIKKNNEEWPGALIGKNTIFLVIKCLILNHVFFKPSSKRLPLSKVAKNVVCLLSFFKN